MPTFNNLFLPNRTLEGRTVPQASQRVQDLGYSVVRKHGDLVDVVELPQTFAFECGPEVCDADLSALEEPDAVAVLVPYYVVEAREVCC